MNFPLVSVIITTKNEERNIANCLKSILQQTYPSDKIEIIVVDNNSTDRTKEIAKKYTDNVYNLFDFVSSDNVRNYRGAQLNLGVKKSKGEIIFFPDADMTFDKDLIWEAVKLFKRFDALYVPEFVCGKGLFGKIRNFERSFYNTTCVDAVRFVKKELFVKVGGFDEKNITFGPDDWDFTKRVKKETEKISITENKIYHHEERMSWKKYLDKKSKYANTFDGYVAKWGKDDEDIKKQLSFYYRFFGVFLENDKWKKLIKHPILTLGMFALRFLIGLRYLAVKFSKRRLTQ